jgi:hypothetical protein
VTLRNDGRGNLTAVASPVGGWSVSSLVGVGDVTGDGRSHAVLVASAPSDRPSLPVIAFAPDTGDGRFGSPHAVSRFGRSVALADVDGDGRADILASQSPEHRLALFRSMGGGRFDEPRVISAQGDLDDVAVDDLDGDGAPDVVASTFGARELVVLLNRGGNLVEGPVIRSGVRSSDPTWTATGSPTW